MDHMTVDIIIPAYRPDAKFKDLIRGLLKQTWPVQNINVIHTRGGRFPWEITELDKRVAVKEIEASTFDHGGTRKMAAGLCKSDLFICMTQDAVPADDRLVENLVHAFADGETACAYARQLPGKGCSAIERYTRGFNYPADGCTKDIHSIEKLGIKAFFCSNVCAAYRRRLYEEQGGFAERAVFNEDMIMAGRLLQAGYKCVYAADARVIHSHNYTWIQQLKRNFDVAVSQVDNPDIFGGIKTEQEGIRLVKQTAAHFIRTRRPWLILPLFAASGFKFLGYRLGRQYKHLPLGLSARLSSNPGYWRNPVDKSQI